MSGIFHIFCYWVFEPCFFSGSYLYLLHVNKFDKSTNLFIERVDIKAVSLRKFHGRKDFRITAVGMSNIKFFNLLSLTLFQNATCHDSLAPQEGYKGK